MDLIAALTAFMTVVFLLYGWRLYRQPRAIELLRDSGPGQATAEEAFFIRQVRPALGRVQGRFQFLRRFFDQTSVEQKLVAAGRPSGMTTEEFFALKVYGAAIGALAGVYFVALKLCLGPLLVVILPVAGWFVPELWLRGKIDQRQKAIALAMPDVLDLLSISLQAGLGFDQALGQVAQRTRGPLGEEFRRFLHEIRMGEPRRDAFDHLLKRNPSDDLKRIVGALIQGEDLGIPIASTLQIQAEEMRKVRSARAKEAAGRASPAISLVAVFLIAPSALCLMVSTFVLSLIYGGGLSGFGAP